MINGRPPHLISKESDPAKKGSEFREVSELIGNLLSRPRLRETGSISGAAAVLAHFDGDRAGKCRAQELGDGMV